MRRPRARKEEEGEEGKEAAGEGVDAVHGSDEDGDNGLLKEGDEGACGRSKAMKEAEDGRMKMYGGDVEGVTASAGWEQGGEGTKGGEDKKEAEGGGVSATLLAVEASM